MAGLHRHRNAGLHRQLVIASRLPNELRLQVAQVMKLIHNPMENPTASSHAIALRT